MLAPILNGQDNRLQSMSFIRQFVFNPYWHLRVYGSFYDVERLQFLHPVSQHFVAHLRNLFLYFFEAFRSAKQYSDN